MAAGERKAAENVPVAGARPRGLFPVHLAALGMGVAAAVFIIVPFWPWLVLALWVSGLASRLLAPAIKLVRGRRRAAALITLALVVTLVLPLVVAVVPLAVDAVTLVRRMALAGDARRMLELLVSPGSSPDGSTSTDLDLSSVSRLVTAHGAKAWEVLRRIAGATTHAFFGLLVFVVVAYSRLAHGDAAYAWVESHAPVEPRHLARVAAAFSETGRGLFIGIGGTALAQGAIATITYAALGVPRALGLGFLTLMAAVIPGIGTGLVWLPVALGLGLTGRPVAAAVVALVGVTIIGTIDNVLKPLLTRHGRLDLPMSVVFLAILGGLTVVGPPGILLGPLVVRLAKEVLVLAKEERERERAADVGAPSGVFVDRAS